MYKSKVIQNSKYILIHVINIHFVFMQLFIVVLTLWD